MNKILIAEDESAIANLIRTALDGPDYRCTWASDGLTACDLLEGEPFDLVLLDIMLPGAEGTRGRVACCRWERRTTSPSPLS